MVCTGRKSYRYVKFILPSQKILCGLVENKTDKEVVNDFLDTLNCSYVWYPDKQTIYVDKGVIKYMFNYTYEYTYPEFEHLFNFEHELLFSFPKQREFLDALCAYDDHIYINCIPLCGGKAWPIPIDAFDSVLRAKGGICNGLQSAFGKTFRLNLPISVRIPFSDKEGVISKKYRSQIICDCSISWE